MSNESKSFEKLGAPIKVEEEEEEGSSDSFSEFPIGAVPFSREELFKRVRDRAHRQEEQERRDEVAETDRQQDGQENNPQEEDRQEENRQEEPEPRREEEAKPAADPAIMAAIQQLIAAPGERQLLIRVKDHQATLIVTPENAPAPTTQVPQHEEEPESQESIEKPKRRLRVVTSDDEEEEEEELAETDPEDIEEEENQITPRKKGKAPKEAATPTPAKRLRTLALNEESSSSEEEEEEEEEETNPFCDSQRDPEYIPDTQELRRDRPSDYRVPKNAPKDPLDLKY
uniref:DUF4604 domain-containing protein n=1 Tax=Caenorhabditis tropicalis TaxID=1561998 RepID=A0A1I7V3D8_9PELO